MRIYSESVIRHPLDLVYATYRDSLPEVAAYIPDVKQIIMEEREESEGVVTLHNVWYGEREIPRVIRRVLKPEMLQWDDYAEWIEADHLCNWSLKTRVFTDEVTCSGTNTFTAVEGGSATRLLLSGNLEIDLKNVPGVPRILAGKLKPQIEKFIVKLIQPNLEQVNRSLEQYLNAQAG